VTLFLGRSFVLTFQERPESDLFESVRLRLRQAHSKLRFSLLVMAAVATALLVFFGHPPKAGQPVVDRVL